jgi:ABC-type Fe3+ transport system permease subunit
MKIEGSDWFRLKIVRWVAMSALLTIVLSVAIVTAGEAYANWLDFRATERSVQERLESACTRSLGTAGVASGCTWEVSPTGTTCK